MFCCLVNNIIIRTPNPSWSPPSLPFPSLLLLLLCHIFYIAAMLQVQVARPGRKGGYRCHCVQKLYPEIVLRHCVCKLNVCSLLLGWKSRGWDPRRALQVAEGHQPPQELEVGTRRAQYLLVNYITK